MLRLPEQNSPGSFYARLQGGAAWRIRGRQVLNEHMDIPVTRRGFQAVENIAEYW